jgi:fructose-specific component phosphotransferase system IIB-like protein
VSGQAVVSSKVPTVAGAAATDAAALGRRVAVVAAEPAVEQPEAMTTTSNAPAAKPLVDPRRMTNTDPTISLHRCSRGSANG